MTFLSPIVMFLSSIVAFSNKFFILFYKCDRPILGLGSPVVVFLNPIVTFSCKFFFF